MNERLTRVVIGCAICTVLIAFGLAFGLIINQGNQLQQGAKASIQSRLVTVQQRCAFTGLMTNEVKRLDPTHVAPFQISWNKCEAQLVKLKRTASATP